MIKYIALTADNRFDLILHAYPNATNCKFQWYVVKDLNDNNPQKLQQQVYESLVLCDETIKKNLKDKWVYCHCITPDDNFNTGCVYLTDDVMEIMRRNSFEKICFYDEDGMIRSDVQYYSYLNKDCTKSSILGLKEFIDEMQESAGQSKNMYFDLMRWSKTQPFWCLFACRHDNYGIVAIGGHYCIGENANLHETMTCLSENMDPTWNISIHNTYFQETDKA